MSLYPHVTLAILTYNQAEYVKLSIEAAFRQDYQNLTILISDDASTDQSYKIICDCVSKYDGPHRVRINRNEKNLGTLAHFFRVVDLSEGELLLLGAGDDLSKPHRTSLTVQEWQHKNCSALFSDYELIDENGLVLLPYYAPSGVSSSVKKIFGKDDSFEIHGASSAYNLNFVRKLPRPKGHYFFEDAYMSFMLHLHSAEIVKIKAPLVSYRQHERSISNSGGHRGALSDIYNKQISQAKVASRKYDLCCYLLEYGKRSGLEFDPVAYEKKIKKIEIKSMWINMSMINRFIFLLKYSSDREMFRWILPRFFGPGLFSLILFALKGKDH